MVWVGSTQVGVRGGEQQEQWRGRLRPGLRVAGAGKFGAQGVLGDLLVGAAVCGW